MYKKRFQIFRIFYFDCMYGNGPMEWAIEVEPRERLKKAMFQACNSFSYNKSKQTYGLRWNWEVGGIRVTTTKDLQIFLITFAR